MRTMGDEGSEALHHRVKQGGKAGHHQSSPNFRIIKRKTYLKFYEDGYA